MTCVIKLHDEYLTDNLDMHQFYAQPNWTRDQVQAMRLERFRAEQLMRAFSRRDMAIGLRIVELGRFNDGKQEELECNKEMFTSPRKTLLFDCASH